MGFNSGFKGLNSASNSLGQSDTVRGSGVI